MEPGPAGISNFLQWTVASEDQFEAHPVIVVRRPEAIGAVTAEPASVLAL